MNRYRVIAQAGLPLAAGAVVAFKDKDFVDRHADAVEAADRRGRFRIVAPVILKRGTEFAMDELPKYADPLVDDIDAVVRAAPAAADAKKAGAGAADGATDGAGAAAGDDQGGAAKLV